MGFLFLVEALNKSGQFNNSICNRCYSNWLLISYSRNEEKWSNTTMSTFAYPFFTLENLVKYVFLGS